MILGNREKNKIEVRQEEEGNRKKNSKLSKVKECHSISCPKVGRDTEK